MILQVSQRYFVAGLHRLDTEEQSRLIPSSPPSPVSQPSAQSSSSSSAPMSRVNGLLTIARNRTAPPHEPVQTQPDYLPLGEDDSNDSYYTIDKSPQPSNSVQDTIRCDCRCPEQLDEMLHIVRELRQQRLETMHYSHTSPINDNRSRFNDNEVTNMSDLMDD
jgi:hypothetical protein